MDELKEAVNKHGRGQYLKTPVNTSIIREHLKRVSVNPYSSMMESIRQKNYTLRHVERPEKAIVIKFDEKGMVRDFAYNTSKF